MKRFTKWFLLLTALLCVLSISVAAESAITILYTNDVHTYLDQPLSYSSVAALKQSYVDAGEPVLLVDAGDHLQGSAFGAMDCGSTIIELMNAAGYDLATPGNHEFDYGMGVLAERMASAAFPYVSCNLYCKGQQVLDSYKVFELDGVRVAIIGISTPSTIANSTPKYFMDEAGNIIYSFVGGADGEALYAEVQEAIDAASQEADYVIGLAHLGTGNAADPWTSDAVIAHTTGLDAVIDGHSHTALAERTVIDKAGNPVILTQTGNYFSAIGKLTIGTDGSIHSELISAFDGVDAATAAIQNDWVSSVMTILGEKIASSEIDFTINDAEGVRRVRQGETNMSDFVADAYYWYFCEKEQLPCDVAITNGGGVRAGAEPGDWTYLTCKAVNTFGNMLCMLEITGQDLLDALEFSARDVGAAENGNLLHPAGLIYEVNTAIESTVQVEDSFWIGRPETYRVSNVMIYDRTTEKYEPLDTERVYRVVGTNHTLHSGSEFAMFENATLVNDDVAVDYLVLAAYAQAFRDTDGDGYANLCTEASPLASLDGFRLDYEALTGAGRILSTEKQETVYVVAPGDCLWSIARRLYGDGTQWVRLYQANKALIGNPDLIHAGLKLRIP